MKTTSVAGNHRRGLAVLILAGAAAVGSGQEAPAWRYGADFASVQTGATDFSRDLLALHRLADPSPFRCYLCRLAPELGSAATLRVNDSPADCDTAPAGTRRL